MMKRVLHLLSTNTFSGAENVACTIIKLSKEESFYCSPDGPVRKNLEDKKINFLPLGKFNLRSLRKVVRDNNIDIIHAHDYKASFLSSFLGRNVKVVSHIHCMPEFAKKWSIFSLAYLFSGRKFKKIIFVSDAIYNSSVYTKKLKNKIVVLKNVVDPQLVINKSEEFITEKFDVAFVGRLTDVKNPFYAINIINEVRKKKKNINFCFLGDGDLRNQCEEEVKSLGLEKNIKFLGFQNNVYPYIKSSRCVIMTSKSEGVPMSIIESLILDKPVIHNGVGGLKKMYEHHKKYICSNTEEFANMILKVLNNPNDYLSDCKDIVKDYIDTAQYTEQLKKIYRF